MTKEPKPKKIISFIKNGFKVKSLHPGEEYCPNGHQNNLNRTLDKAGKLVIRITGVCPKAGCEYAE